MKQSSPRHFPLTAFSLPKRAPHFRFTTLSGMALLLFLAAASGTAYVGGAEPAFEGVAVLPAAMIAAAVLLFLLPYWPTVLLAMAALWAVAFLPAYGAPDTGMIPALIVASIGVVIAPCLQIADQWQNAIVLRFGRFRRVFGPGPHIILPVADRIVRFVDMRIRVTDFSAEKSITSDTVPVHVDALAFWMVWDAEKAILEVESFYDAVTLSAQTALRDAIGRNDLATLLSERERLGSEIQTTLDAKTSPWGITILSIEFTEILVPKELEDALSKQAQAERERRSRSILSATEVDIAKQFEEAAASYEHNPTAFQLRSMNMVYESIRANKNIVLMPSSTLDSMNLGTALGVTAFARSQGAGAGPADADAEAEEGGDTTSSEAAMPAPEGTPDAGGENNRGGQE